jgi:hypothetical protein
MAGEEIIPGAGDGGGAAIADPPADDVVVDPDAPTADGGDEAPPAEDPDAPPPTGEEGDLSDIETDGRKIEGATRAAIAALKKVDPAAAKRVAESYFRDQAVLKETGAKNTGEAITQIRTMKATIESLGGEQGIADLQTEVADYRKEIEQFAAGDPALIQSLGEANPEGLAKSGTQSLEWLKANKPEIYENTIRAPFMERFNKLNFPGFIASVKAAVKEGKGQEAWDLIAGYDKWLKEETGKLESAKAAPAKNPEAEKLAKEKAEFEETKQKDFISRVDTDVNRANNPELDKLIGPLQKQLGLQKEGMNHFRNGLIARVWKVLANDKPYLASVKTLRSKGDAGKLASYIHGAFKERLPEQFRLHRNEIYPNIGKTKAPAPAAPANGKQPQRVINIQAGQRPKREDVDWSKTTDTMWISGRAILTNGKSVSGFKDAPANKL